MQPTDKGDSDWRNDLADIIQYRAPVRALAQVMDLSVGSISKARAKFDNDLTPQLKLDSIECKEDSIQIADNIYEFEGIVLKPQNKFYKRYNANCITPRSEIERIYNDPTYAKEFRIGVTSTDDHSSSVPSEVLENAAIGTVSYRKLDQDGIHGKVRIDLSKADKILGEGNWLRQYTESGQHIPLSVARLTKDIFQGDDRVETNIDIRSYVATRRPRNKDIGID